jgi:hypothetical protein
MTTHTEKSHFVATPAMQRIPAALAVVGVIALVAGLVLSPERTYLNLLIDGFYVLSLGVSALFFITTQRLSSSHWSAGIRRIPEAFTRVLPAAAVMMIVLAFGFRTLYPWAAPGGLPPDPGPVRPGHETYLNATFVYVRMIVIVGLWLLFAWRFRKASTDADASREAAYIGHVRMNRITAVFAPLFAFTFTAAAYDWLISLDPKWFSTMFAVFVFAGSFVQGVAAIALAVVRLRKRGSFGPNGEDIGLGPVHTLGTMMLAFSTFWAYIWVCQYLLIWYGNIPEEATYYLARSSGPWLPIFLGNFVINWIIPFFVLLPRSSKRSTRVMTAMACLILVGRWIDLYMLVMPSRWESPRFGILELAMAAGTGGMIYLIFIRGLSRAPLIPTHEPTVAAQRALEHH